MTVETEEESPLSWKQARARLRTFLEEYMSTAPTPILKRSEEEPEKKDTFLSLWLKFDLDLYIGAFGATFAIVIISGLSLSDREHGTSILGASAEPRFYRSHLAASVLLLSGCIFDIWVVARRRYSCSRGSDSLKRREISKFLRAIERQEENCVHDAFSDEGLNLVGTSLTDIYPVYRLRQSKDHRGGSWTRIPTLLLVRGDHIALQTGDIAPAECRVVEGPMSSSTVAAGERITLETFGETTTSAIGKLPRGRTTLPKDSDELLALSNHIQIFVLLESPLEKFLRAPRVEGRKPQVVRQLEAVRAVLSIVAIVVFLLTTIILFSRSDITSSDLSLILPLPFLAALGVLPLTGPSCLAFIEVLGTARILASYHQIASFRQGGALETQAHMGKLLLRYVLATASNRLSLQDTSRQFRMTLSSLYKRIKGKELDFSGSDLVRVPPASLNLLEKLGVATAFSLVDDELACEPDALPQQLLVPSGKGLKLLDICPTYEDESDDESDSRTAGRSSGKLNEVEDNYSDSDSDDGFQHHTHIPSGRKRLRLLKKHYKKGLLDSRSTVDDDDNEPDVHEVQFEDPLWWQHLPSLKCIGLACLLVDEKEKERERGAFEALTDKAADSTTASNNLHRGLSLNVQDYKRALVRLVCAERRSSQLRSLAHCIGFSTKENVNGEKGDTSPFTEKSRLHVVSTALLKERLEIDSHERGSEESRWWGLLRPDSTSVILQDSRSGAYQLVTVGDPRVVTRMCQEAWQGESSTILPLAAHDRKTILDTSNSWKLADLDVAAFSYAPIPHTFESRCKGSNEKSMFYLLDNDPRSEALLPNIKDKTASGEWPLVHNQIFLGILGSLVIPREEIQGLLGTLQDAGVRFVYFSPRNMRRQKEIASQMGIDVAWNCAISLRPLDAGEEDPHRMVSAYADWDVNAKLPHGIESVKRHLKEVDNVPLLVSLFTDVTKETTRQMIETFQEYNDTVITIGLSHLPRNSGIFSIADLSVGVDVLTECIPSPLPERLNYETLLPSEITFVSAISAYACAFRLNGVPAMAYMPTIIAQGRASLEAATSASLFMVSGCLSFAFYVLFCVCTVATSIPFVPVIGAVLHLQLILPLLGLTMTMSDLENGAMTRVPPKNDQSIVFGPREGKVLHYVALMKALPPAVLPQLLHLIVFGEFVIHFEPDLVASVCSANLQAGDWASVVRCQGLKDYTGVARTSAGALVLAELLVCTIVASTAFVSRTQSLLEASPWRRNRIWAYSVGLSLIVVAGFLGATLERGSFSILPWYFFVLAGIIPFICLAWDEFLKGTERNLLNRAEKLRRLQFETRLGMWSPK